MLALKNIYPKKTIAIDKAREKKVWAKENGWFVIKAFCDSEIITAKGFKR